MRRRNRALLRLAVRDARRDRWRSLLVLVVVALPVAGLVGAATVADTVSPTAAENVRRELGRADVWLGATSPAHGGPADTAALLAALPALPSGSEVAVEWNVRATTVRDGLQVPVRVTDADLSADALGAGRLQVVDGRAPLSDNALALSATKMDRLGVAIGDRIEVAPLGDLVVVGEVRDPEQLSREFGVVAPGRLDGVAGGDALVLLGFPGGVVPDLGPDVRLPQQPQTTEEQTFSGTTRTELESNRFGQSERWFFVVVGGLFVVEVALVAGAAFAVSVRRRQRELGLLAATGATTRQVRRSVLLTGATVGLAGALVGAVVGLLAVWFGLPVASRISDRVLDGMRVDPGFVLAALAIGSLAAVVGAWWPARSVARLPVLTALSGRRPVPTGARAGLWTGLGLVGVGGLVCLVGGQASLAGATPFVFLFGCILVVLGAGLTSPWLLEQLGRTARFLPAGPRLAVRDAARFRGRNGPIVTAAMAGLAAAVTVSTVVTSLEAEDLRRFQPTLPDHLLSVQASERPGAAAVVADAAGLPSAPLRWLTANVIEAGSGSVLADGSPDARWVTGAVLDDGTLAHLLAGPDAAADLAAGRAVALVADAPARIAVHGFAEGATVDEGEPQELDPFAVLVAEFPVASHALAGAPRYLDVPQVLVPETAATRAVEANDPGWETRLLVGDGPLPQEAIDAATAAAAALGEGVWVQTAQPAQTRFGRLVESVTIGGGLAGLLIVVVAIALAAAEARGDLRTLTAVGAGRRTRRSLAAGRALLLAGLGGVLAVPVGLLPAVALLRASGTGYPVVLPWPTLLVVALGVPLTASVGAWVASRRDPQVVRAA